MKNRILSALLLCLCVLTPQMLMAENKETQCDIIASKQANQHAKMLKAGDYVTIFMGREARNITIDWGQDTNCIFDIQISCGHGSFNSVSTEKATHGGVQTYKFIRTTVEELRIVILKGQGSIRNMQTLSTKADDSESYNPI